MNNPRSCPCSAWLHISLALAPPLAGRIPSAVAPIVLAPLVKAMSPLLALPHLPVIIAALAKFWVTAAPICKAVRPYMMMLLLAVM